MRTCSPVLTDAGDVVPGRWRRLRETVRRHVSARRRTLWVLSVLVATALLIPTVARLDLTTLLTELGHADLRWLVVAVLANFATLPLMAVQWRLLLPRERRAMWRPLGECVAIGMAAMNTLPAAGGHVVASGLLASRGITTIGGAVSLLTVEQLCEAVGKLALVAFVIATVSVPAALWRVMWITLAGGVAIGVGMFWVVRAGTATGQGRSWRSRWAAQLETLRSPWRFGAACALSVLMKVTAAIAIDAVQRALGVHLPAGDSALVLAAVTFAAMISVTPGSLGFFELGAVAAYQFIGIPGAQASVLAILVHVGFLVPILGTGYAVIVVRAVRALGRRSR